GSAEWFVRDGQIPTVEPHGCQVRNTPKGGPHLTWRTSSGKGQRRTFSASGSGPCLAPRRCHKPNAIGHDQKPVRKAHPRRRTAREERNNPRPLQAISIAYRSRWDNNCSSLPARLLSVKVNAIGEPIGDKSGYAVQVADDDRRLKRRKDARDKKSRTDNESSQHVRPAYAGEARAR